MAATPAAADTLPGRDTPFTPSQAAAAQYTTPTPTTPLNPQASPAVQGEIIPGREAAEGEAPGGTAPAEAPGGTAPATEAPAVAPLDTGATTSPPRAGGTLPFTGGDLLALVWIALALVALGTVAEVIRRRLEARGS
jgi:DNA polymerase-3 subunit gamma/tau